MRFNRMIEIGHRLSLSQLIWEVIFMKHQAVVRLNFSSKKQLIVVLKALKPEIETSSTSRSKIDVFPKGKTLILNFMAKDTSALRAAINSYLRLVGMTITLQNLTE